MPDAAGVGGRRRDGAGAGAGEGPHRVRGANSIEMRDRENGMRGRPQPAASTNRQIDGGMEGKRDARPRHRKNTSSELNNFLGNNPHTDNKEHKISRDE